MDTVGRIFDLLDRWRHLPDYQLERRADVFFAAYLPQFLGERLGLELNPSLIPEFPVRIGTVYPKKAASNQSCKVDYLALTRDRRHALLIELKTDAGSRRDRQDEYLERARAAGLPALLEGVRQIVCASLHRHKYAHLLRLLAEHELLALPDGFEAALASRARFGACVQGMAIGANDPAMRVVYVEPTATGESSVGFGELAEWLGRQDDAVAGRFARSLRAWGTVAGRG